MAWHLGKRDIPDTTRFILKVRKAVSRKRFQISSDSWEAYERAIASTGSRIGPTTLAS